MTSLESLDQNVVNVDEAGISPSLLRLHAGGTGVMEGQPLAALELGGVFLHYFNQ